MLQPKNSELANQILNTDLERCQRHVGKASVHGSCVWAQSNGIDKLNRISLMKQHVSHARRTSDKLK